MGDARGLLFVLPRRARCAWLMWKLCPNLLLAFVIDALFPAPRCILTPLSLSCLASNRSWKALLDCEWRVALEVFIAAEESSVCAGMGRIAAKIRLALCGTDRGGSGPSLGGIRASATTRGAIGAGARRGGDSSYRGELGVRRRCGSSAQIESSLDAAHVSHLTSLYCPPPFSSVQAFASRGAGSKAIHAPPKPRLTAPLGDKPFAAGDRLHPCVAARLAGLLREVTRRSTRPPIGTR